jgi:hypothetical protein
MFLKMISTSRSISSGVGFEMTGGGGTKAGLLKLESVGVGQSRSSM